jgi:hypothetical protein
MLIHIQSIYITASSHAALFPEKAGQTIGPASLFNTSAPIATAAIHKSPTVVKTLLHFKSLIPLTASPAKLPSPATTILSKAGMQCSPQAVQPRPGPLGLAWLAGLVGLVLAPSRLGRRRDGSES